MSTTVLTNTVRTATVLTTALTTPTAPCELPRRAARRPRRLDWETCSVSLLMLASAGAGLYRLLWMGQL